MFDRLIGMETEYALRFRPASPNGTRVSNANLFKRLLEHVQAKMPVAPSMTTEGFGPHTWFMANGGAVHLERVLFFSFLSQLGLVEGSSPECRSPRQLLLHQRAQDVLLSQAAAGAPESGEAALIKNNCDAFGNFYGSHENYEATLASGFPLLVWRCGLVVLLPTLFLLAVVIELATWVLIGIAGILISILCVLIPLRTTWTRSWEFAAKYMLDVVMFPIRMTAGTFAQVIAFRRQRRGLAAFLASRPIITGSGALDKNGRFHLSARALAIGSVCGVVHKKSRPFFLFNHFLNDILRPMLGDRFAYARLFRSKQRLQISMGDSNMTQTAEYLKIGTTWLVLEAIEAGALEDAPRLKDPVSALHTICADTTLQQKVPLRNGEHCSALEIQRSYLQACRRFVERRPDAPQEAKDILRLWEETLDALERDPGELVGKLDWVTKRHLLDQAGADASLAARRKIDVRYHELSQAGYYLQMEAGGLAPTIVEPEEVLHAMTTPPTSSPAAKRAELIRAHADSGKTLHVNWSTGIVGTGWASKIVRFR